MSVCPPLLCMAQDERKRGERGEYVAKNTLEDVEHVFDLVDTPFLFTSDVEEELGCSETSAYRKLTRLHDQGRIEMRSNGRTNVWYRPPPANHTDEQ